MSLFSDALQLLDDEFNVFAFLPAINYGYFYWQTNDPSTKNFIILSVSILLGAIAYNILTEVDFEQYGSQSQKSMSISSIIILVIIGAAWILIFGFGLNQLFKIVFTDTIWPVILIGISMIAVSLILTDWLLREILPIYPPENE